jgi:hypothetical protein
MNSNRDCFFTSIALNYLPKALALAKSVFEVYPATRFVISVIDLGRLSPAGQDRLAALVGNFAKAGSQLEFLDPLLMYADPALFRYKYSVVEACTAIKPAVALHLLASFKTVTYLDPDVILYAPLPVHGGFADDWDFQVTPHILGPAALTAPISERLFMFFGTFNLGYFAVRASDQTLAFLQWWKVFCEEFGANAPHAGLFVDQKPVDLLPSFVDKVSVLRHPGCNTAWWNIFCDERQLDKNCRQIHFKGGRHELIFFHFSNLDREPDVTKRLVANPLKEVKLVENPALEQLYAEYDRLTEPWVDVARSIQAEKPLSHQADAPKIVRLLLSEALRCGLQYKGNPFDDGPFRVALRSAQHIVGDLSMRDVKEVLAAILSVARLGLAPRLLRYIR